MKIVVLDGYSANPGDLSWDPVASLGQLTVYDKTDGRDTALVIERIGDARAVLINGIVLGREVLSRCPALSYIGTFSTGYNTIDLEAAKELGIAVCHVPSYGTKAVAQFTMALLLEVCLHVGAYNREVQEGRWRESKRLSHQSLPLMELAGRTFGIIGLGRIGREVAGLASAFGMEVIAYSPRQREEGRSVARYVPFEELLGRSDVVSLHCPLFPETREIINEKSLALMKKGAILLNTARGPLIEEAALARALKERRLCGAGLDVVAKEPIREDNPLLGLENCIITPHVAWMARETRKRLLDTVAENLREFLAGNALNRVV